MLRRCPKNLQPTYFERVVDICQTLQTWWSSLPPDIQNPTPSSPLFRSNAHLKLSLHLTDIFVGRPFIFSHTPGASPGSVSSPGTNRRPDTSGSDTPNTTTTTTSRPPRSRASLVARAVEAAVSIVALLRTMHEATGLARSSYTEFSSCRAALLVMLARSVDGPQTAELKAAIELGMQLIRRMAAGNVSTQSETSVIEALEIAVRRLMEMQAAEQQQQQQNQQNQQRQGGGGDGVDVAREGDEAAVQGGSRAGAEAEASKTGYERFREWASLWPVGSGEAHEETSRGGHARSTASSLALGDLKTAAAGFANGSGGTQQQQQQQPTGAGGAAASEHAAMEHSPESTRWLSMMDTGVMGVGIEQLDDLGLFGGFPELGALDGWPGLV